jgi:RNA polymerase sigma-70 factor (ECF subfamily)
MIDWVRKNKRTVLEEDFGSLNLKTTVQQTSDVKKVLNEAICRLNDIQRSLILLKDYEGYSYEEIAQIASLNLSQVKVYLHRARIQLKNYLVKPENII